MSAQQSSILLIGATGLIGKQLLQAASLHPSKPVIHAFVRSPSKITQFEQQKLASVILGDATSSSDIRRALQQTSADTIMIGIGTQHLRPQHIREKNAKAIAEAVASGSDFQHVKIVIISAHGANESSVIVRCGAGMFLEHILLRKPMQDHSKQETILRELETASNKRVYIVRPTYLTHQKPTGKITTIGAKEKVPKIQIDREDLAKFVIDKVCGDEDIFGTAVSITNAKSSK